MTELEIRPLSRPPRAVVRVPGSKSLTNRALLLAALAEGDSVVSEALFSEDTRVMSVALRQLGVAVEEDEKARRFFVRGNAGNIPVTEASLHVGNAGTAARFLVAYACLGRGRFVVDGSPRMRERPIGDLLEALGRLGAKVSSPTGCPPVRIEARGLEGGRTEVRGAASSQYLSALLLVAPYARSDTEIEVSGELVAKPYVDMTLRIMEEFGVRAEREGYRRFFVPHGQSYRGRVYRVEADASSAHYFWAAAALTGGEVTVEGVGTASVQGDVRFADVLERMGAEVVRGTDRIAVRGTGRLRGLEVDMNAIPDTAPTLAVLALFAEGPVRIRNVAHLRIHESERIRSVATELRKLGGRVEELEDGWAVEPSELRGAELDPRDDHRLAMAFSLAGLRVPGVRLRDPDCVRKTFPDFFAVLDTLRGEGT
ncbi:MAG: 3-phosphoshikimate 1-carboxyvinyltransferase [Candidatus Binatia bacterium]|nr:MAG: 3-phosphoshikimate 1-carboxyvinyltransferase [Candidatus Binatia bacterium]